MQITQHNKRCPVYLHPAAASNPTAIAAILSQSGVTVIAHPKFSAVKAVPPVKAVDDCGPWGGDAA